MNFSAVIKLFFTITFLLLLSLPGYSITISPATHLLETQPGGSKTFTIRVLNDSNQKVDISCYMSDFEFDKKGSKIFRPAGTTAQSIAKYITIAEPQKFILGPQESKEVTLTINIPEGVVGGNRAIAFFQSTPSTGNDSGKKMLMSVRAGATILQETVGTVDIRSRITKAEVIMPDKKNPFRFQLKVKNEGNTYITTGGTVTVLGENDYYVGSMELNKTLVYPGREALLEGKLPGLYKLRPGTYNALVTYQFRDKTVSINKVFTVK